MHLVSTYHAASDALEALTRGELDAVVTDNTSAHTFAQSHPGSVEMPAPPLTDEPFVVAMPAAAPGLGVRIDATINSLRTGGQLEQLMGLAGR
jgi:ABC-type amino acid transport substrate-binding protein